jgi:uncharacterized protein
MNLSQISASDSVFLFKDCIGLKPSIFHQKNRIATSLAENTDMNTIKNDDLIVAETQKWLEKAVIGLNLCPFAKAEHVHGRIRYCVSAAAESSDLLLMLEQEITYLLAQDPAKTETTLLIVPQMLGDFLDYNDFLDEADAMLEHADPEAQLQIASFHPLYQFGGTAPDDMENYTNRSPYPMLHLLREDSVELAVASYPDAASIYERNIATLKKLGLDGWRALQA